MTRKHTGTLPLMLLLLLGLTWTAGAVELEFSATHPLRPDGRVSIDNINGDVTIEAWDNAEVKIEYTKRARTQEGLDRMEVHIDASADRIHIETEYARRDRGWHDNNSGGEVELRLWVPRQARLDEIELINGGLEIRGVEGDVTADLINGRVRAEGLMGDLEIETVNGDIEITMADLPSDRSVRIESVNGSIELTFPSGVGADIEAETVHGRISNDFGIEVTKGRYVGRSMRGTVGSGGARVELENINGAIRIRSN